MSESEIMSEDKVMSSENDNEPKTLSETEIDTGVPVEEEWKKYKQYQYFKQ